MNMKFALAAGVCAASLVGFSDVTSANVVGYDTKATPSAGSKMIAPDFETTGSSKIFKLSDLRGTELEDATGDLCLSVLTSGGGGAKFTEEDVEKNPNLAKYLGKVKKFYWFAGGWNSWEPGWYNADGDDPWDADEITFTAGDAFWTSGIGQGLQSAGQVGQSDVTIITPSAGSKATGNPFPVNMKLSTMYGTEEDDATGDLCLSVLTTGGGGAKFTDEDVAENPALAPYLNKVKKFYWFAGGWNSWTPGWYNADGDDPWDAEKIIFKPSDGLWVSGIGQSFVFPAPKLNK